jgi:hypothetical protein
VIQFAVVMKEGQWSVFRDGEVLTLGLSRSRAVERAELLAHDAAEAGDVVELLVQDYIGALIRRPSR